MATALTNQDRFISLVENFSTARASGFRGIRRRPDEAMQPLNIKTMSDRLVAATAHASTTGYLSSVIRHLSFAATGASRTLS
jgi:hypothetical protein